MSSPWKRSVEITHIGTATAILSIDGINFITDPFFSPAGSTFEVGAEKPLEVFEDPALGLQDLPVIDAVLLSHENHPDNLDELGRRLLDGRRVFTTVDGAKNLAPRPAVHGLKPWDSVEVRIAGKVCKHPKPGIFQRIANISIQPFQVTATPAVHMPGHEACGLILTTSDFGATNGLPNAIYFSGDTIYTEELAQMREKFHIKIALFNVGRARTPSLVDGDTTNITGPIIQITMDGKQAAHLFRDIGAEMLVPMHFESWKHFTEHGEGLKKAFREEGIEEKVRWMKPGVPVKLV